MNQIDRSQLEAVKNEFDADFYVSTYNDIAIAAVDPLQHFMDHGWQEGRDPNPNFSTLYYLKEYAADIPDGMNPLVHYVTRGKANGLDTKPPRNDNVDNSIVRQFFNEAYYLFCNPDVRNSTIEPLDHYMRHGWIEGRNPNPNFSTLFYMQAYKDVLESGMNPLMHYAKIGHLEGRETKSSRTHPQIAVGLENYSENEICARYQDMTFPIKFETAKRIIVVVVPEHNTMSGGIYSMFSIAKQLSNTQLIHGYEVIIMTNPNKFGSTYYRQRNFINSQDVFRFDQLSYCKAVEDLYILLPEYASKGFLDRCSTATIKHLVSRKKIHINLLNQNIKLMPQAEEFTELRRICDSLTQSVAHHAYFSQEIADKYNLPTLLLPAYTDLSDYRPTAFEQKEDLIIYSYDKSDVKESCLKLISEQLPKYKLVEILGIPFSHYMELATRCRFSISFGEGYDGYIAQPIHQGGIGFTVYDANFFPSETYLRFPNIFSSGQHMLDQICKTIQMLEQDKEFYNKLNQELNEEHDKLYRYDEYQHNVRKLALKQFDLQPKRPA